MKKRKRDCVLILGLGNTIVSDDGVGVYAARRARALLSPEHPIDVAEAEIGGLALLDLMEGYPSAVLIDAMKRDDVPVGTLVECTLEAFVPTLHLVTGHQVDLPTALALGRELGYDMPRRVIILAVQVSDVETFGEVCSPEVSAVISELAERAVAMARKLAEH